MNFKYLPSRLLLITSFCLLAGAALCPDRISAASAKGEGKVFNFEDQYIQIEARKFSGEGKGAFGVEVSLTPKAEWKLLAGNSSSIRPLRLKPLPAKCLKLKGAAQFSPPDLSGTDDSGSYAEYYTKTASIRQEFLLLKCAPKNGLVGAATLTYLLCQNNKCVGPFSKEIRF